MLKTRIYILLILFGTLFLSACDEEICNDSDRTVFFDSFQNRLKIDPGYFEMASDQDTIGFRLFIDYDGFTNGKRLFCEPKQYENYWTYFDNGSGLHLSLNDFIFWVDLYFNEERKAYFQIRQVDGVYAFYNRFDNSILEEYSLEILPTFEFNGIELNDVTKIQAIENGQLLEELIFQREKGILTYRNLVEFYEYNQLPLE